jgi:hypothetical protein
LYDYLKSRVKSYNPNIDKENKNRTGTYQDLNIPSKSNRLRNIKMENTIPLTTLQRFLSSLLALPRFTLQSRRSTLRAISPSNTEVKLLNVINPIGELELVCLIGTIVGLVSSLTN